MSESVGDCVCVMDESVVDDCRLCAGVTVDISGMNEGVSVSI